MCYNGYVHYILRRACRGACVAPPPTYVSQSDPSPLRATIGTGRTGAPSCGALCDARPCVVLACDVLACANNEPSNVTGRTSLERRSHVRSNDGCTPLAELREMYDAWPWFREHVDLIAMILAKADLGINANYDAQARTLPPERERTCVASSGVAL